MKNAGYSLIEVVLSMGILLIVSALSFVVLQGSTETAALAEAKSEVQANLRDVMAAVTSEVRAAYTNRTLEGIDPQFVPEDAVPVTITDEGRTLSFTVPRPEAGSIVMGSSGVITYRYINEDGLNDGPVNGRLDPGEDEDGDGVLSRRIVRIEDGVTRVVGGVNDLSDVVFTLLPNAADNNLFTSLSVRLESSKGYGPNLKHEVRAESVATIALQN